MDPLEQRLKRRTADFDLSRIDPQASLPGVVRRGRRYLLVTQAAVVMLAGTAVAAGAVAVPRLLERPPAPAIVGEPSPSRDDALPAPVTDEGTGDSRDDDDSEGSAAVPVGPDRDLAALRAETGSSSPKVEHKPLPEPDEAEKQTTKEPEPSPKPATSPAPKETKSPAPAPKETTTPAPQLFLTANQKHSTVDSEPPTNRYWGTATPGQKVKVYSDFGWASTVASADGTWDLVVTFDAAPAGETTFKVLAKLWEYPEHSQEFTLTTVRGEVVAFTATQQSDTVSASDPRGHWWGTGAPGSRVWVYSEYGQTEVVVDDAGSWAATLVFVGAPVGQPFDVKVKSLQTGQAHWFTMTVVE